MLPKIILHNSVSLDCSVTGFEANLAVHYGILSSYRPDAILVGSKTAKIGIKLFYKDVPAEDDPDFSKPEILPNDPRAYWLIADSRGILEGLLHVYRRSEYGKDVIVLVSERTPASYINYLKERNYDYLCAGDDHVDFRGTLKTLKEKYGFKLVVSDSGGTLNSILLEQGLAEEISLVVCPVVVGKQGANLFRTLENKDVQLEFLRSEALDGNYVHLLYRVFRK